MEAIAKSQLELGRLIERNFSNFTKDSMERKSVQYAQNRLATLDSNWEMFTKNNEILQEYREDHGDHSYFKNNYFASIKAVQERHRDALTALLDPAFGPKGEASTLYDPLSEAIKRLDVTMKITKQALSNVDLAEKSIHYHKYHWEVLKGKKKALEAINEELWSLMSDYEESSEKQRYEQVSLELQNVLVVLQEQMAQGDENKFTEQPKEGSAFKLPKITLPIFTGAYLQWVQFKELFENMVDGQNISDTEKMFYLIANLKDEAFNLVQHLPVCAKSYKPAWEILKHRYDNKRLLVTAFLNKLTLQPGIQTESASAIKRLHDTTKECIMGLKNLGLAVEYWDALLIHIIIKRLDKTSHTLYEQSLQDPRALDKVDNVLAFLETRFQALEALNTKPSVFEEKHVKPKAVTLVANAIGGSQSQCIACNQSHPVYACKKFREFPINKRMDVLQKNKCCFNCLRSGHSAKDCVRGTCNKCNKKHNTLLHRDVESTGPKGLSRPADNPQTKVALVGRHSGRNSYILLGTVTCAITTADGQTVKCRALLDSGSQINGISERIARKLQLATVTDPTTILGIGNRSNTAQKRAHINVTSPFTKCELQLEAFIIPQITNMQPSRFIETSSWNLPKHVTLADPSFNTPGPIDVLIGAEHYFDIIKAGHIDLGKDLPSLQDTVFGWIVSGKTICENTVSCFMSTREDIDVHNQIKQFWEFENVKSVEPQFSRVEKECEEHYTKTTKRDNNGRFIVRLPFTQEPKVLGNSRQLAMTRFFALERKLERNPTLKSEYHAFMKEYLKLGHMTKLSKIPDSHYYLPHHCVVKPDRDTTKVRVVFDASAKTTTNVALNDILHTGPKIQQDILTILLRFRVPRYVCSADIEKMYRQVIMHEDDRKYQLILWRDSPLSPIKTYSLNTVTYGFTSAPFHAIRCLHELAKEASYLKPWGTEAIRKNMYVDDAMFGADSLPEALKTQEEMVEILKSGGFHLRKWCANHPAFTQHLPNDQIAQQLDLSPEQEHEAKALGLIWLPTSDEFRIKVNFKKTSRVTKRQILSDIAHLFDPLGLVGPVTVTAKIILQKLWSLELNWDEAVPQNLEEEWLKFRNSLPQLSSMKIPRHICAHNKPVSKQLHVFCDASEKAYGAALYIRSTLRDGTIIVRLLCAKSRITPLKVITIPRLELCAAKLGSELVTRVKRDLDWHYPVYLWTDSTIVLSWLRSPISSLHKFVANRVSAIQELTSDAQWKYVPTQENPADLISRGMSPENFVRCQVWLYGPLFLHGEEDTWPRLESLPETSIERKTPLINLTVVQKDDGLITRLSHISSITKMQRTIAYILRFTFNINYHNGYMKTGDLNIHELEDAMELIIKEVQEECFSQELRDLQSHKSVNPKGSLGSLSPFLDERGIIRVGGRLENSSLAYEAKHPIVLQNHHFITKLILRRIHIENNHVGPGALLAMTRQTYWPINGKSVARSTVQRCVLCARHKPKLFAQIMGDLPSDRVQPSRPFLKSGVDFCGPFYVRQEIRGKGPLKAYLAIFCCFATKAVHLEVVKNLTTEAFISALKRFTGRRGNCETIYCDNATNFVGANNQLQELVEAIYDPQSKQQIDNFVTKRRIQFNFIPPRAPHFGGLWEAAVKSAKQLLKKAVGTKPLTYEEFTTIAVEIEAILNSRPLTPMSDDPNDLAVLTPGHFLIGGPVNATIDPKTEIPLKPLPEMSKDLSNMKKEFWTRWQTEYLNQLQQRHKWKTECQNVEPGTMVILKDDKMPTSEWPLGRILKTVQGRDGKVRAAEVMSGGKIMTRVIHHMAPLPIEKEPQPIPQTWAEVKAKEAKQPEANSSTNEPTKKKRRVATSLLTALIVLCCITPSHATNSVNITPITNEPGLYFEKLGSASLAKDEWTMVAYYNLSSFWKEYELINKGIQNLQLLCTRAIRQAHCQETVEHFDITLANLAAKNTFFHDSTAKRSKRSPLDIIGNVAHSLFGVLDSQYAEKMSKIIKELDSNDQHLLALIQNQTTIIDSTRNIITKSDEITTKQFMKVYQALNNTANMINSISKDVDMIKIIEDFNVLSIRLILTISDFQRVQDLMISVLIDTQHGKVNPMLLTPVQLQAQTQLIKEKLPPHLTLPYQGKSQLEIYQMLTVAGRITGDKIIFRIKIPLLATSTMDLIAVTPIPVMRGDKVFRIKPTSTFMLINVCYVCRLEQTSLDNNKVDACELQVLLHTVNTSTCQLEDASNVPRWQQLAHLNKWLYTTTKEVIITSICNGQLTHQAINGVGVITVPNGCSVKDGKVTIEPNQFTNTVITTIIPKRNLSEVQVISTHNHLEGISGANRSLSNELNLLQHQINTLKEASSEPSNFSYHDAHQYGISYSCFALIIFISIGGITWCKLRSRRQNPPIPKPRSAFSYSEDDFTVKTAC